MCLIVWAYEQHPEYRLILAANRDEFYERPTTPVQRWPEQPGTLAGRDLRAGGTWMGVGPDQRWAALTNVRDPSAHKPAVPSRGGLVADYLLHSPSPADHAQAMKAIAPRYEGFNLLVADRSEVRYVSSVAPSEVLSPGVYGLSNATLNTPWPKVTRAKQQLHSTLQSSGGLLEDLFTLLQDTTQAADEDLPATGMGLKWERRLSPIFISSPNYGTRASTVLLMRHDGGGVLYEQTYDAFHTVITRQRFELPC